MPGRREYGILVSAMKLTRTIGARHECDTGVHGGAKVGVQDHIYVGFRLELQHEIQASWTVEVKRLLMRC